MGIFQDTCKMSETDGERQSCLSESSSTFLSFCRARPDHNYSSGSVSASLSSGNSSLFFEASGNPSEGMAATCRGPVRTSQKRGSDLGSVCCDFQVSRVNLNPAAQIYVQTFRKQGSNIQIGSLTVLKHPLQLDPPPSAHL